MENIEKIILKETINGQEWKVGDKFFCPIREHENGKWVSSAESFKFLKYQYDAINSGWAFRFQELNDGTCLEAIEKCEKLVNEFNDRGLCK